MKPSLKNFPKPRKVTDEEGDGWYYVNPSHDEYQKWKDSFEKQLQESLKKNQRELKLTSSADARHCGFLAGLIVARKEILGEEK